MVQDILFIDEELPYDLCIFNEDRFIPFHAHTQYVGHWNQEMGARKRRYWGRKFSDREVRLVFINNSNDSRKMLNKQLGREEFMYLLELINEGDSVLEALKRMKIGYEVGEFY